MEQMDEAGKPMRGWRGSRQGRGELDEGEEGSRGRGSCLLQEGEKAVTRIRDGGGNSARHRHQKVVAELEAADGWKRLVQAATQQCTVQFLVEGRSNAGGHDVGSRWRREINVSNHLEPQ